MYPTAGMNAAAVAVAAARHPVRRIHISFFFSVHTNNIIGREKRNGVVSPERGASPKRAFRESRDPFPNTLPTIYSSLRLPE